MAVWAATKKMRLNTPKNGLHECSGQMAESFSRKNGKLSQLDEGLSHLNGRFSHLNGRLSQMAGKFIHLDDRLSQMNEAFS